MGGKLWSFLLLGCCLLAGCQQTETVSVPPVVGCYPVEGYAPDPADLAAAPYTYTGGAQGISVTCTVWQAEPAAFFVLSAGPGKPPGQSPGGAGRPAAGGHGV